jgi:glycosyltransferase involved in cell wall biosynthesis
MPELEGRVVPVPVDAGLPAFARTRGRALRAIRPALVHCPDLDPPAMLTSRLTRRNVRLVVTYNTPELRPRYNAIGRLAERAAWSTRPWVIYTSERDRATSVARDPVSPERAVAIPYGVDVERFAPRGGRRMREALGIPSERRVVGTVGRLVEQKGHTYLIQAAERLAERRDDVDWVIVGDGVLRSRLEDEVRRRGVADRVHLVGERDDVPEWLSIFDVFALPSTFEGMCFAVAEALAVEVPVVATDVGGVGQSVVHGETGLLVQPRDPEALAQSIARLLDDGDEATRLARAGRERVRRLYALATMVERTESLYLRALGRTE